MQVKCIHCNTIIRSLIIDRSKAIKEIIKNTTIHNLMKHKEEAQQVANDLSNILKLADLSLTLGTIEVSPEVIEGDISSSNNRQRAMEKYIESVDSALFDLLGYGDEEGEEEETKKEAETVTEIITIDASKIAKEDSVTDSVTTSETDLKSPFVTHSVTDSLASNLNVPTTERPKPGKPAQVAPVQVAIDK